MDRKEQHLIGAIEGIAFLGAQIMYAKGWRLVACKIPPEMQDGWELQTPARRGRAYVIKGNGQHEADNEIDAWARLFAFGGLDNPAINLNVAVGLLRGETWQIYNGARSKYVECMGQRVELEGDHPHEIAAGLTMAWWMAKRHE